MNESSRREFLNQLTRAAALATPCAAGAWLGGCTVPVRSFTARPAATVDVPLRRYPELERPGGTIKVRLGQAAVFLQHLGDDRYRGVSAVCTHQACLVSVSGQGFSCPCHGSEYDADGKNIRGPARRPLPIFKARRTGESVRLFLGDKARREA